MLSYITLWKRRKMLDETALFIFTLLENIAYTEQEFTS